MCKCVLKKWLKQRQKKIKFYVGKRACTHTHTYTHSTQPPLDPFSNLPGPSIPSELVTGALIRLHTVITNTRVSGWTRWHQMGLWARRDLQAQTRRRSPRANNSAGGSHTNFKHCNPFFRTKNIWDHKSTNLILNPPICWKTVRLAEKSEKKRLTAYRRRMWDCELLCVFGCVCRHCVSNAGCLRCPGSCKRLV